METSKQKKVAKQYQKAGEYAKDCATGVGTRLFINVSCV